eukprot:TRINITY_DN62938_c0_g1_i1.p1 TRINITY_DN62938_c0_g1~~TRINITY_DN62938_c0_g1_i1.p1  ORF type:complete len:195 (+),score=31.84 TRINITY_DN62938_c0_g1_i1:68-652(+)
MGRARNGARQAMLYGIMLVCFCVAAFPGTTSFVSSRVSILKSTAADQCQHCGQDGAQVAPNADFQETEGVANDRYAFWKPFTIMTCLGLMFSVSFGDAARADLAKPTRADLYYGQMVFGFKISDCDAVKRGKEPLCDDIEDWSKKKPVPASDDRVKRWRSVKTVPGKKTTVTETLDDKCIIALAQLIESGTNDM